MRMGQQLILMNFKVSMLKHTAVRRGIGRYLHRNLYRHLVSHTPENAKKNTSGLMRPVPSRRQDVPVVCG